MGAMVRSAMMRIAYKATRPLASSRPRLRYRICLARQSLCGRLHSDVGAAPLMQQGGLCCPATGIGRGTCLHLEGIHAGSALLPHQPQPGKLQRLQQRSNGDAKRCRCLRHEPARSWFQLVQPSLHRQAVLPDDCRQSQIECVSARLRYSAAETSVTSRTSKKPSCGSSSTRRR